MGIVPAHNSGNNCEQRSQRRVVRKSRSGYSMAIGPGIMGRVRSRELAEGAENRVRRKGLLRKDSDMKERIIFRSSGWPSS